VREREGEIGSRMYNVNLMEILNDAVNEITIIYFFSIRGRMRIDHNQTISSCKNKIE
jgi:hypothetical protein